MVAAYKTGIHFFISIGWRKWPVRHFMMMQKYHMATDVLAAAVTVFYRRLEKRNDSKI
jgi:hypothetical protein